MGQKHSCFDEFRLSRYLDRRRARRRTADNQTVNNASSFREEEFQGNPVNPSIPKSPQTTDESMAYENVLRISSENLKIDEDSQAVKAVTRSETPEFHIKDGTLILGKSKEDTWTSPLSSKFLPDVPSPSFWKSGTVNEPEAIVEETYQHAPPYIPPKLEINFLQNDLNGENILDSKVGLANTAQESHPPPIPPRINGIIFNTSSSKPSVRNPPQIPPRKFKK